MWPAENGMYVVVGAQRIACARVVAGRWQSSSAASVAHDERPAVALETLALPALDSRTRWDLHVLISDRWLSVAEVLWGPALEKDAGRAEAHVRQRLVDAGFSADEAALIRLDDSAFGQPRLAIAYPADLISALRAFAQRHGARLRSALPLSVAAWHANARPDAVAVVDAGSVLVATAAKRRLHQVVVRPEGGSWQAQWARMQMRDPRLEAMAPPAVVDLGPRDAEPLSPALGLARAVRKARSPLDVVMQRSSAVGAWLAAAGVAAVAAALSLQLWQVRGEVVAADAAWRASHRAPAVMADTAPWTRQERARVQSVNVAIRELNLPIGALLAALQPPRDLRIAVLSVDVSGASTARITAETRTAAEMAQYAAFVASRQPFTGAYVIHHEIDAASPERPYRFALEASWRE